MFRVLLKVATFLFGSHTLRASYRSVVFGEKSNLGLPGIFIKLLVGPIRKTRWFKRHVKEIASELPGEVVSYSGAQLDRLMNSVLDMPEVVISSTRPQTINVLVPAFSIETMSAGFFGVFQCALMISRQGFHVRLVLFDNFHFDKVIFRNNLQKYTGLETLLDEVELDYIGDRYMPLKISPHDSAVATVWYSAYFARKIMATLGGGPFLYFIQDYEAAFYPFNSLYALADATYSFSYNALVSTEPLYEFMKGKFSYFAQLCQENKAVHFNNSCSAALPLKSTFIARHAGRSRKLAFYSRPTVNRNMFELGAKALITAWNNGYFDTGHNWDLYGIGIGDVEIYLDGRSKIVQLPRMSLSEYERKISEFDICVSLMASPHPSITPFDLAGVGAIVVTNQFFNKTRSYFDQISKNILVSSPDVSSLAETIRLAISRVDDLESRFQHAVTMNYPRDWKSVWQDSHKSLISDTFNACPIGQTAKDVWADQESLDSPSRPPYRVPEVTGHAAD